MTDVTTRRPLRVLTEGTAGPFILVPAAQMHAVENLLKRHGVRCWAHENLVSIDHAPAMGIIDLGRNGDAQYVQNLLDSAP